MLYALPTLTEDTIAGYISANYSGSYSVGKAFSASGYELPLILVKAGKFKEVEPDTHLYEGSFAVTVLTQVDDVEDPVATHDATVAAVYDLMADRAALFTAVNAPSGAFHLHSYYTASYDQDRTDRALLSIIEYTINCQTLAF